MDAKEFLIKNKVDTSYVETFCNKNGWSKINLEDLLNSFIEHYKENQALQLQQTGVMWRCFRQFRMKEGKKEICFKNGGIYEQVKENPLTLRDEDGIAHELSPSWVKWFHNAT